MWKRGSIVAGILLGFLSLPATARTIQIEYLESTINPSNVQQLGDLACREYDKIVHLNILVSWSGNSITQEKTGFERLVFWNDHAEYLFPKDSYFLLHGDYVIDGYFIPRRGGEHQGVISNAFQKIDDVPVLLSPDVEELKAKKGC